MDAYEIIHFVLSHKASCCWQYVRRMNKKVGGKAPDTKWLTRWKWWRKCLSGVETRKGEQLSSCSNFVSPFSDEFPDSTSSSFHCHWIRHEKASENFLFRVFLVFSILVMLRHFTCQLKLCQRARLIYFIFLTLLPVVRNYTINIKNMWKFWCWKLLGGFYYLISELSSNVWMFQLSRGW